MNLTPDIETAYRPSDHTGVTANVTSQPALWTLSDVWRLPLPELNAFDRVVGRLVMAFFRRRLLSVEGLEHIAPVNDPFVLIANHNQKAEAVLVPSLMITLRGGRGIRFLSDWMFQLIPVVSLIIRRGRVITLTNKPARPRFLNLLKPLWHDPLPALVRARKALEQGECVGVYPEGTLNRDPRRLLPGNPGAARLSLESGRPVVPLGIRFPGWPPDRPIGAHAKMALKIGAPLTPPVPARPGKPTPAEVRAWHAVLMQELSRLSGKTWSAPPRD
ncbi:MAG: lysophospholipid acyltransferase family protein [Acidobacteriota bacterium]